VVDEKEATAARRMIEKQTGVCETGETLFAEQGQEGMATHEINQESENHFQKGQTGSKTDENTTKGVCLSDCEVRTRKGEARGTCMREDEAGSEKEALVSERARRAARKRRLCERGQGD
jgi:hypothetical protein